MSQVNKKLTDTILSMSLLTVMAGAAIAPALGVIKEHFSTSPALLVQFIVSIPALLIIITNLFFLNISRHFGTRQIALAGLMLYVLAGAGCFLADDIYVLLTLRAFLGVSVGLVMPLSTGLLAYYYPPEQQAHLMGLSAAMNQMGGVVATLLAGLLAGIGWQWAFLVYLLGVFAIVMVVRYLPDEHLGSVTTVMPLLSASLYLGQFLSPVIVTPLAKIVFGDSDVAGAYKIGIVLCVIFLIQVYTTRHYQSLPPEE